MNVDDYFGLLKDKIEELFDENQRLRENEIEDLLWREYGGRGDEAPTTANNVDCNCQDYMGDTDEGVLLPSGFTKNIRKRITDHLEWRVRSLGEHLDVPVLSSSIVAIIHQVVRDSEDVSL